jgi:hypothetical protein
MSQPADHAKVTVHAIVAKTLALIKIIATTSCELRGGASAPTKDGALSTARDIGAIGIRHNARLFCSDNSRLLELLARSRSSALPRHETEVISASVRV